MCGDASLLFRPRRLLHAKVPPGALLAPPGNFYALFAKIALCPQRGAGAAWAPPKPSKNVVRRLCFRSWAPRGRHGDKKCAFAHFQHSGSPGTLLDKMSQSALKVSQVIKKCTSATPGENVALAQGFWMVLEAPGRKKMILGAKVHFLLKSVTLGAKVSLGPPSHPWRRNVHFLLQVGPLGVMPPQNHQ